MNALIVVDLQNDFMPGGPLGVAGATHIIDTVNALMPHFELVVATQDWHPSHHGSFAVNHPNKKPGDVIKLHGLDQILWPTHCVQNTKGAAFVDRLHTNMFNHIVQKGTDPTVDSYSGFFDNGHKNRTNLDQIMRDDHIQTVYICGVATDYCVRFTAMDAITCGFGVKLIADACRGVDLEEGDVDTALDDMCAAGVILTNSTQIC